MTSSQGFWYLLHKQQQKRQKQQEGSGMGNKVTSPVPSYEAAAASFQQQDLAQMQASFRAFCGNQDTITLDALTTTANASEFVRQRLIPRIFTLLDAKKQHFLTVEEYVAMNALFLFGLPEERVKFLFLLYDPSRSGYVTKEALVDLFIDANAVTEQPNIPAADRTTYIKGLRELLDTMVDMAMLQYAPSTPGKMTLQEFGVFFQIEGSLHTLLTTIPSFFQRDNQPGARRPSTGNQTVVRK